MAGSPALFERRKARTVWLVLVARKSADRARVSSHHAQGSRIVSPAILKVCFSADHRLFSWNTIPILAVIGLFFVRKYDRQLGLYLIGVFVALMYIIGCCADWYGLSSFGNRYFVSLAPLSILGLAALFDWLACAWQERRAAILASSATAVLIFWNLDLIFQWGTHLFPARGPTSWREAEYNQFAVVPAEATRTLKSYLMRRGKLMDRIEQEDVKQLKSAQPGGAE